MCAVRVTHSRRPPRPADAHIDDRPLVITHDHQRAPVVSPLTICLAIHGMPLLSRVGQHPAHTPSLLAHRHINNRDTMVCYASAGGNANARRTSRAKHYHYVEQPRRNTQTVETVKIPFERFSNGGSLKGRFPVGGSCRSIPSPSTSVNVRGRGQPHESQVRGFQAGPGNFRPGLPPGVQTA
jgi:hypothetical protein